MNIDKVIEELKLLEFDLDNHPQGHHCNIDCVINELNNIKHILSCPEDMTVCSECLEFTLRGKLECQHCHNDFTR